MTKFINRKYIKKCIELILYLLHYKISYQSYVKIESHIDYSIFYELSFFFLIELYYMFSNIISLKR